ncbi:MAG: ATP-binding protein [Thaumarchaeota archaeon]|nr:ATP-binding protein [Nitrososphaerota archaeon]
MKKSLTNLLKEKQENDNLDMILNGIKNHVTPLLGEIRKTFPDYTPHDIEHKERVMKNYEKIIPDCLANKLNKYEIFFLAAATYLHDIGMVDMTKYRDFPHAAGKNSLADNIRDTHHIRSEKYVNDNFSILGIEEQQAKIIGIIARGHREEDVDKRIDMFDPNRTYREFRINMPLLTTLLRLADEFDMTFERTPMIIYEYAPPKDPISLDHWKRQKSISGLALIEETLTLLSDVDCEKAEIHRVLKKHEEYINEEICRLARVLYRYEECLPYMPREFQFKIKPKNYIPHDLKFSLKNKEIVQLLMGEKLYPRKSDAIRELLKNSYDTVRLRAEIELKTSKLRLEKEISIELSTVANTITIRDNGLGMDLRTIDLFFSKIGESFYSSEEFREQNHNFVPVSELGIGFLSAFMLAEKIKIETKKKDSEPLDIVIEDLSDFFIIEKGIKKDIGTTVTLFLKPGVKENLDLFRTVQHYAKHLDFTIGVIIDSKQRTVSNRGFSIKTPKMSRWEGRPKFLDIAIDEPEVEGNIFIIGEHDEKGEWFPSSSVRHYGRLDYDSSFSLDGFFVTEYIPFEWTQSFSGPMVMRINFKCKSVDLNVSRDRILKKEKPTNVSDIIAKKLAEKLDMIFNDVIVSDNHEEFCVRHLAIKNFIDDAFYYDAVPMSIKKLIDKYYPLIEIDKHGLKIISKKDLDANSGKIIQLESYNSSPSELYFAIRDITDLPNDAQYIISPMYSSGFHLPRKSISHIDDFFKFKEVSFSMDHIFTQEKLVRFKNIQGKRLFYETDESLLLNADNPFMKLILENSSAIPEDIETILKSFFFGLSRRIEYEQLREEQKLILKWLEKIGKIPSGTINNLLIKKEDYYGPFDEFRSFFR